MLERKAAGQAEAVERLVEDQVVRAAGEADRAEVDREVLGTSARDNDSV